jgi:molybdopterin-guanine dinucleotide biosynthesis protein A
VIDALVLAGGRISGPYATAAGTTVKGLVCVGGEPVVRGVIRAVQNAAGVGRVCVVGPEAVGKAVEDLALWQAETPTAVGNLLAGIQRLKEGENERLLLCGSDVPFMDSPSVEDFLSRAPAEGDICMPVVWKSAYEAAFPGSANLYVALREGAVTAGSQYLIRPRVVMENKELLDRLFNQRKSQVGMARTLGYGLVWKLLTRRLSIPELEARLSALSGCRCRALLDCRPELAFDIDRLEDLEYARKRAV